MNKKMIAVSVIALVSAMVLPAFAQTAPVQPMTLQVGQAGNVLLRGTIASMSGNTLTVNSWGGAWTVNVGASTQVLPAAANGDLSQFKTGDFVGVQGSVSQSANWTINATLVRDWTYRAAAIQERQQNAQTIAATIKTGTPKNYEGTASNVSGSTFTLTSDGTAYTVNVAAGAEVVNRGYLTLPLVSIQSGDDVRVWGVNASGTITVQVVRDMSAFATSTKARM